ncbi:MAG: carbamoyltransferase C-terminal domain-containing protein [Polyangiaceae bacterium]
MSGVILGINCTLQRGGAYTYDGNVALVGPGGPIVAIAEERISRVKHDGRFQRALQHVLERTGTEPHSIEAVAVCSFAQTVEPEQDASAAIVSAVEQAFGFEPPVVLVPSHHEAHALAAAAQCGVRESLIAVIDNEGSILGTRGSGPLWTNSFERTSYYVLRGGTLTLVARDHDDPGEVGYGKLYSKVTRYIGFETYHHAGKTMGLAPFGDPHALTNVTLFASEPSGRMRCSMRNTADGLGDLSAWFAALGVQLPEPRAVGAAIRPIDTHLAAWAQHQLEASVVARIKGLLARHALNHVCISGGVSLNSVLNRRLQDELGVAEVFVPSSPGDAGLALGAAAYHLWKRDGAVPHWPARPFLGWPYEDAEIERAVTAVADLRVQRTDDPVACAVKALARGKVVGWFQGASEYGPRALGHRSILANPRNPWMKDILNHQVKGREWFRPYAPSVLWSAAGEHFEIAGKVPFMMQTAPARAEGVKSAPACVHVDGTARLQTVTPEDDTLYADLLQRFGQVTGAPIVLDTSFNLAGMPIVETPEDAVSCFRQAPRMDVLIAGTFVISR